MKTLTPTTAMQGANYNRANGKDRKNTWWHKPVDETSKDWMDQLKRNYERGAAMAIDTYWLHFYKSHPDSTLMIFNSQGVDPMSGEPYLITRKVLLDDSVELVLLDSVPEISKPTLGASMRRKFQPVNVKMPHSQSSTSNASAPSIESEDIVNPFGKLTDDLITDKVKRT